MFIQKCIVSRTGLFNGNEICFTEGLNVIYSGNGSGKTLLMKGILEALCSPVESGLLLDSDTIKNLYLDIYIINAQNEKLRITNNKDKYLRVEKSDSSFIYENPSYDKSDVSIDFQNFIETYRSFVPVPVQILSQCCYVASQSDNSDQNLISEKTLRSLFLTDRSKFHDIALKFEMFSGEDTHNTLILDKERFLKDISKKIQLIHINHSRLNKLQTEKEIVKSENSVIYSELAQLNERRSALTSVADDLTRLDVLNTELTSIKEIVECEKLKIEQMTRMKAIAENNFPQFRNIRNADPEYLNSLQGIYIRIRNVNEKLESYISGKQKMKNFSKIALTGINSGLLAAGTASWFLSEGDLRINQLLILSSIAACFSASIIILNILKTNKSEYDSILLEKKQIEEELRELLSRGQFHLDGYRLDELYEFLLQYFEDYIRYMDIRSELSAHKSNLRDGDNIEVIRKQLEDLYEEHKNLTESIKLKLPESSGDKDFSVNNIYVEQEINRLNGRTAELTRVLESKNTVLSNISIEIESFRENTDELQTLNNMKSEITAELTALQNRKKIIKLIQINLKESAETLVNRLKKQLISSALDIFNRITDNRHVSDYDDIFLNSLLSDIGIADRSAARQIHLLLTAIKISLSGFFLDRDRPPPLIIDEPFQYIDETRASHLKKILEETAAMRQVIVLTHHSGKEKWGNFIQL